jgi:sialic acid synthase SpsE
MTSATDPVISLTPQEARALFIRLKRIESEVPSASARLSPVEQSFLLKIEKSLYRNLSIQEAESLMNEVVRNEVARNEVANESFPKRKPSVRV